MARRGQAVDKLSLLGNMEMGDVPSHEPEIQGARNRLADLGIPDRDVEAPPVVSSEADPQVAEFMVWAGEIKGKLQQFAQNIKRIEEKQAEVLTSTVTKKSGPTELDMIIDETQEIAQSIRNQLKKMESENKELEKTSKGSSIHRIRTNMQGMLTKKFCEKMDSYQKAQEAFKRGYKERIARQYSNANPSATREQIEAAVEGNADPSSIFISSQLSLGAAAARNALEDINEKHREIRKLEESMIELHQLFVDMSVMVEAQGELLNNIEHSVEQTVEYVASGNTQLEGAKKLQKAVRKKMFIIICCLSCLLLFLVGMGLGYLKMFIPS